MDSVRRKRLLDHSWCAAEIIFHVGKDGTGRLWDDVFADRRLLFMPPATSALLVLFCRNHNVR